MMDSNKPIYKNVQLWLITSLTLGLAPFSPPHIWGKLVWLWGGGAFSGEAPMQGQDWFDLLLHGSPWIMLIVSIGFTLFSKTKEKI